MVRVTTFLVALVLFAFLLVAALLLLGGIVPAYREAVDSLACGLFKLCQTTAAAAT